ncbi:DUF4176 domain-containing protein [Virgibacillus chiguensis]|uniref:DUF4176 domain-containing protein n=1 Tax=Virgibacillus chiguensis TaxID=411959 RepID=A0A1M5NT37_9BACI|nr:DUF4176 domain-containing protein [Virgibacillus chiguensis]SHG92670.1 hypothetical protein SAMN05421807_102334 [Virgibacillus chiguensis]
MEILPIGSVVQLKNGDIKLMIINRAPLYNKEGVIGYFDYSASIYPTGKIEEQVYFFNHENIDKVFFEGYIDEQEELFQKEYNKKITEVKYPKFTIDC